MEKILLVDDNMENMDVLFLVFEEEGFKVKQLGSAEHIDLVISEFKPILIFMDVMLNGANGMEICTRLKSDAKTADIKIVLMTASHAFDKPEHRKCNADHYLPKPFDINEVIAIANRLIG